MSQNKQSYLGQYTDRPAIVPAGRSAGQQQAAVNSAPVPPAGEEAPEGRGSPEGGALWRCPRRTPLRRGAGVQRAEPFGAVCGGHPSAEELP